MNKGLWGRTIFCVCVCESVCALDVKGPQQWTRGSADKDLPLIAQKGRSCSPIRSGVSACQ